MFYYKAHIPIAKKLSHIMHEPTIYIINNRATRRRIHGNFIISLVYLAANNSCLETKLLHLCCGAESTVRTYDLTFQSSEREYHMMEVDIFILMEDDILHAIECRTLSTLS